MTKIIFVKNKIMAHNDLKQPTHRKMIELHCQQKKYCFDETTFKTI